MLFNFDQMEVRAVTLDNKTILISLAVIGYWLICSCAVYGVYASMPQNNRDRLDNTSGRRIFWVISGPIWVLLVVCEEIGWQLYRRYRRMRRALE